MRRDLDVFLGMWEEQFRWRGTVPGRDLRDIHHVWWMAHKEKKQKWKWVMDGAWEWVKNLQVLLSLSAVKEKSRSGNKHAWMARGNGSKM